MPPMNNNVYRTGSSTQASLTDTLLPSTSLSRRGATRKKQKEVNFLSFIFFLSISVSGLEFFSLFAFMEPSPLHTAMELG